MASATVLGPSTLTVTPSTAVAGSTGNTLNFVYTSPNAGLPGTLTLKVAGFSVPTLANVSTSGLSGCTSATPTAVGAYGVIKINFDCGSTGSPVTGGSFDVQVANVTASKRAGTYQVIADTTTSPITAPPSISVVPGPAAILAVKGLPASLDSEVAAGFTVTAEDAYKNLVPSYAGTVKFSSTDPRATLPPAYTFQSTDAGTHAFSGLLFYTPGKETIYAGDASGAYGSGSTKVIAPTSISISPTSQSIVRGTTSQFTASVVFPDQTVSPDPYVIWSSDTPSVAKIGPSTGLAAGVSVGAAGILATLAGVVSASASPVSVTQGSTSTSLISSANPSISSQPVTLTATVAQVGTVPGPLTGDVTFSANGSPLGTSPLLNGNATLTYAPPVGSYDVVATYGGDLNNAGSSNSATPFSQVVNAEGTTVGLSSSTGGSSEYGQPVTFTATVSPQSSPAGLAPVNGFVTFTDSYGFLYAAVPVFNGTASWTDNLPPVGTLSLTASFIPTNTQQTGSSAATTQTVTTATPTVSDSPSETMYNPGDSVTFTVTVTGVSGAALPSGSVTVDDGQGDSGTATLSSGTAMVTIALNSSAAAGGATLNFTASYGSDTNYGSASDSGSGGVILTPATPST